MTHNPKTDNRYVPKRHVNDRPQAQRRSAFGDLRIIHMPAADGAVKDEEDTAKEAIGCTCLGWRDSRHCPCHGESGLATEGRV